MTRACILFFHCPLVGEWEAGGYHHFLSGRTNVDESSNRGNIEYVGEHLKSTTRLNSVNLYLGANASHWKRLFTSCDSREELGIIMRASTYGSGARSDAGGAI